MENEEYFIKWKEDLNIYMDNISKIVPLEKIILVKGRSAYAYKDKFGNRHNVKTLNYQFNKIILGANEQSFLKILS